MSDAPQLPSIEAMARFAEEVRTKVNYFATKERDLRWLEESVHKARKAQAGEIAMCRDRIEWLEAKLARQHEYLIACRAKDRCEILRLRAERKRSRRDNRDV